MVNFFMVGKGQSTTVDKITGTEWTTNSNLRYLAQNNKDINKKLIKQKETTNEKEK